MLKKKIFIYNKFINNKYINHNYIINFFFFFNLKKKINKIFKKEKYKKNIKYIYNIYIHFIINVNFKKFDIFSHNFKNLDVNVIVNFLFFYLYKQKKVYTKINDYKFYFYFLKNYINFNI